MSALISELLPAIASLSRAEKFQLIQLVISQLAQEIETGSEEYAEALKPIRPIPKKSLRGCLRQHANPELIEQEQNVWQRVVSDRNEYH